MPRDQQKDMLRVYFSDPLRAMNGRQRRASVELGPIISCRVWLRLWVGSGFDGTAARHRRPDATRRLVIIVGIGANDSLSARQSQHFITCQRFVLQQRIGNGMKLFDIGTDNLAARFIRLVDNTPDFFIDQFRGRFRDILRLGNAWPRKTSS